MKSKQILAAAGLSLLMLAAPAAMVAKYGPAQGPPPGYGGQGGWDGPPQEFNDAQRHGFHDGLEGARRDYENHRPPDVRNRDEFRHPGVPGNQRRDYREGFRRGYDAGVRHMAGGGDHDHDHDHDHDPH